MKRLQMWFVWLSRIRYSRGFGVQSPSAYQFIRYVINEHFPYYVYDDLREDSREVEEISLKLAKLYFRISNWKQSNSWIYYGDCPAIYKKFICAGCKSLEFSEINDVESLNNLNKIDIVTIPYSAQSDEIFVAILEKVCHDSLVIIEGIKRDSRMKHLWKKILSDARCGVTYDLYYCGLVFFDLKKYKQNYVVNF